MNLSQLEARFRTDTDDAAVPYLWSSPEVISFLNEAQEEAAIRGKLIFDASTVAVCQIPVSVVGGAIYPLHAKIHEIVYASITDSSGEVYRLELKDREELNRIKPDWRTAVERPEYIIHLDNTIRLGCLPDASYTINLEVHRLPLVAMALTTDTPEINGVHHTELVQWALYRAYSKPDADAMDLGKAQEAYAKFERYFGVKPNAELRKDENANRPHVNKVHW